MNFVMLVDWFFIALLVVILLGGTRGMFTFVRKQVTGATPVKVAYENAHAALDRMKDWATWLAGIQTAAMAAVAALIEPELLEWWKGAQQFFGILALWFLGISVFGFAWLLAALPSIQQRLRDTKTTGPVEDNDIYKVALFPSAVHFNKVTLEAVAAFAHYCGIIGMLFLSVFFIITVIGTANLNPVQSPSQNFQIGS